MTKLIPPCRERACNDGSHCVTSAFYTQPLVQTVIIKSGITETFGNDLKCQSKLGERCVKMREQCSQG